MSAPDTVLVSRDPYAPIVIDRMMVDVASMTDYLVDFDIFDGTSPRGAARLYDGDGSIEGGDDELVAGHYAGRTYQAVIPVTVGGRPWTIVVSTLPAFDAACSRVGTTLVLVASVVVTLLASALVYALRAAQVKAVAMAAGMLPTAIGLGEGAEFRQPMAVAVIGGLITSTALSLLLVPVVYEFVDDFEHWLTPKLARFITKRERAPVQEATA